MKWWTHSIASIPFLVGGILLSGCYRHPRFNESQAVGWGLDSSIPGHQKDYIEGDLKTLNYVTRPSTKEDHATITDDSSAEILGVTDFSKAQLTGWLDARVKVIVGENFKSTNITAEDVSATQGDSKPVKVMENLGTRAYLVGLEENVRFTFRAAGRVLTVTSPRVGLLRIHEGLFKLLPGEPAVHTMAASFIRLAAYFHEARHSDGNGDTLGFAHANCPSSMGALADLPACDRFTNGPYAVGKVVLGKFYDICGSDCSYEDLEGMSLIYADIKRRVLHDTPEYRGDPTPVGY